MNKMTHPSIVNLIEFEELELMLCEVSEQTELYLEDGYTLTSAFNSAHEKLEKDHGSVKYIAFCDWLDIDSVGPNG